jgi:hypothetical protein
MRSEKFPLFEKCLQMMQLPKSGEYQNSNLKQRPPSCSPVRTVARFLELELSVSLVIKFFPDIGGTIK